MQPPNVPLASLREHLCQPFSNRVAASPLSCRKGPAYVHPAISTRTDSSSVSLRQAVSLPLPEFSTGGHTGLRTCPSASQIYCEHSLQAASLLPPKLQASRHAGHPSGPTRSSTRPLTSRPSWPPGPPGVRASRLFCSIGFLPSIFIALAAFLLALSLAPQLTVIKSLPPCLPILTANNR